MPTWWSYCLYEVKVLPHRVGSWLGGQYGGPIKPSTAARAMLKLLAERLMRAEVEALCGARYATRSGGRTNSRNGLRYRRWATDCGTIRLALPKLRHGHY